MHSSTSRKVLSLLLVLGLLLPMLWAAVLPAQAVIHGPLDSPPQQPPSSGYGPLNPWAPGIPSIPAGSPVPTQPSVGIPRGPEIPPEAEIYPYGLSFPGEKVSMQYEPPEVRISPNLGGAKKYTGSVIVRIKLAAGWLSNVTTDIPGSPQNPPAIVTTPEEDISGYTRDIKIDIPAGTASVLVNVKGKFPGKQSAYRSCRIILRDEPNEFLPIELTDLEAEAPIILNPQSLLPIPNADVTISEAQLKKGIPVKFVRPELTLTGASWKDVAIQPDLGIYRIPTTNVDSEIGTLKLTFTNPAGITSEAITHLVIRRKQTVPHWIKQVTNSSGETLANNTFVPSTADQLKLYKKQNITAVVNMKTTKLDDVNTVMLNGTNYKFSEIPQDVGLTIRDISTPNAIESVHRVTLNYNKPTTLKFNFGPNTDTAEQIITFSGITATGQPPMKMSISGHKSFEASTGKHIIEAAPTSEIYNVFLTGTYNPSNPPIAYTLPTSTLLSYSNTNAGYTITPQELLGGVSLFSANGDLCSISSAYETNLSPIQILSAGVPLDPALVTVDSTNKLITIKSEAAVEVTATLTESSAPLAINKTTPTTISIPSNKTTGSYIVLDGFGNTLCEYSIMRVVGNVANKSELARQILACADLLATDYTAVSWEKLRIALTAADSVRMNKTASQLDVDTATSNLAGAKTDLINIKSLKTEILDAETWLSTNDVNKLLYSQELWKTLTATLARVKSKLNSIASAAEATTEQQAIRTQRLNLENSKTQEPTIVKTQLTNKLAEAQLLKPADYTKDSWDKFEIVRASAEQINQNPSATQAEVDSAVITLTSAMTQLVKVSGGLPPTDPETPPVEKPLLPTDVTIMSNDTLFSSNGYSVGAGAFPMNATVTFNVKVAKPGITDSDITITASNSPGLRITHKTYAPGISLSRSAATSTDITCTLTQQFTKASSLSDTLKINVRGIERLVPFKISAVAYTLPEQPVTPTPEDPTPPEIRWDTDELIAIIQAAKRNDIIEVDISSKYQVSSKVFDVLKSTNTSMVFTDQSSGFALGVKGKDIKSSQAAERWYDLSVCSTYDFLQGDKSARYLDRDYLVSSFGISPKAFKSSVAITTDYKRKEVYRYGLIDTDEYEYLGSSKSSSRGLVEFTTDQYDNILFTSKKLPPRYVVNASDFEDYGTASATSSQSGLDQTGTSKPTVSVTQKPANPQTGGIPLSSYLTQDEDSTNNTTLWTLLGVLGLTAIIGTSLIFLRGKQ